MVCVLDTPKFANGSHPLPATAYDASGKSRSDVISINVQNTAPNAARTVSVTSPTAGQTVSGTAMAYAATATDDAGVSKVDFFIDSTSLGTKTSAPYGGTLDTTKLANGTHVLKAVAYDAQGLSATSQVSINVSNTVAVTPTPTPTTTTGSTPAPLSGSLDVWFKAPLAGATIKGVLNGGTGCYVNASGSVAKVAFSIDSTALNTDSTPSDGMQCVLDTTKVANGTHQLNATAYGADGTSRDHEISVNGQNTDADAARTVSLTSPTSGQTVSGTALAYSANAADDVGVARVDFFVDSTSLGSKTSAPYSGALDTTKLANGTHVLKAVAYDAQGLSATSQVSVNVSNTVTVTPTPTTTATAAPRAGPLDVR